MSSWAVLFATFVYLSILGYLGIIQGRAQTFLAGYFIYALIELVEKVDQLEQQVRDLHVRRNRRAAPAL